MRTLHLITISVGVLLASCSTTRNVQYGDDVYYSKELPAQEGDYVTVYNGDEQDTYNYREDYEIRRGIRSPLYRTSFNIGLGMGSPFMFSPFYGGFGYSPFYSSFYDPFYYGGFHSAFSMYYSPFGNPFFNPFYGGGYFPYYSYAYNPYYSPYYGGAGHYYSTYPYYGRYPAVMNNGPRVSNIGAIRSAGVRSAGTGTGSGSYERAPVRTLNGSNNGGTIRRNNSNPGVIRRVFGNNSNKTENGSTPSRSLRSGGEYVPSGSLNSRPSRVRESRTFSPSNSENNRMTAPRNNDFNSSPSRSTRSFESSQPRSSAPTMRQSSPSPSRSSGVRRF